MFALTVSDLVWRAGPRTILDGLNLRLDGEGITVLLGPNGAGKSVLLRHVCGLLRPDAGLIDWNGAATPGAGVSMVFQQPRMFRDSILGNVALALTPRGIAATERRRRAAAVLERVGLAHRLTDSARGLSGGERQRLALARAWVTRPQLLLLDEPTASLDPSAKREVEALIDDFARSGMTLVMSTHNLGQVKRLATRVVYLEAGRLVVDRPVERFFHDELPTEAAQFLKGELPWT